MKKYLDLTPRQLQALQDLPEEKTLQMLNLLKFKDHVSETNKTGKSQYQEYMVAAGPFIQKSRGKVIYYGTAQLSLIGPEHLEWDQVLIVEYPSKREFLEMVTTPGYPAKLRKLALEDSRLIFCGTDE